MPNGKVVVTDISPKMLAVAKTRVKALGLDGIMEFRESDGEKIDLPDLTAKFNAVLSRFGLMFFQNLNSALINIRHLLITDGRLSAAVCLILLRSQCQNWLSLP
jgi:ubiquinone/menaquinone biosynthesis C-methylase UbiE